MPSKDDPLSRSLLAITAAVARDPPTANRLLFRAWGCCLTAARSAVRRAFQRRQLASPDTDDLAVEAAYRALAEVPDAPDAWADHQRVAAFATRAGADLASRYIRRGTSRGAGHDRRVDPLFHAVPLLPKAYDPAGEASVPASLVVIEAEDDLIARVLEAVEDLPTRQREAVRAFLAREAGHALPPPNAAEYQAWARAKASLARAVTI